MKTKTEPYELLIRWGLKGELTGAQIQYRHVLWDGEKHAGDVPGPVTPLKVGDFPLHDLLSDAESKALSQYEDAKAENERLTDALSRSEAACHVAEQRIGELTAELKKLRVA